MSEPYFGKYEEMKKWYYRLQGDGRGKDNIFSTHESHIEDYFRASFTTCHHFKDWIIKSGVRKDIVESYINQSKSLSICADLCTYSKHAEITRKPRASPDTRGNRQGFMINPFGPEPSFVIFDLVIQSGGKTYDAFKLAEQCIKEWDEFLNKNKLPIPTLIEEKIYQCFEKE